MKTKYVSGFVALCVLLALALPAVAAEPSQSNTFSGYLTLRNFKDQSFAGLRPGTYEESLLTARVTVKITGSGFNTPTVEAATGSGSFQSYFPSTCNRPPEGRKGQINGGTIGFSGAVGDLPPTEATLGFDITGTTVSTRCVQGQPESTTNEYSGSVKNGNFYGTVNYSCGVVTSINFNRSTTDPDGRTHVTTGALLPQSTIADPAGPFTDTIGPINPFVVLRENEALAGGQKIGAPSVVGFNDAGQVALQAVQAVQAACQAGAPGNNYLLRLTVPGSGPVKELSSFVPSLARKNIGLRLRDDGGVISFDSFDSPSNEDPPIVNGRIWQGESFALLPAALREVGEAIAFGGEVKARAVSANGNFYLVAISRIGGRETVLLNGQGSALQTFPDVVPFEPIQISDDGQFLGAPSSNPDNIHVYQPNGQAIQVGNPVQHIRLSRDGTALARLDKLTGQTLSLVLRVVNPGGAVAATVINPSASDTFVDPFEAWHGTQNGVIQANQIIGGVRKFLDVLAVQRLNRPLGDQIMTVIEAEDTAGVAGLYYIRSSAGSGKVFASSKIPRIAGLAYPDTAGHSAGSDAFLNRRGEIVVQDSTPVFDAEGGVTGQTVAFSILHANTLTKFKQGSYGSLLTGLAANPETRWFDQPVNPNATKRQSIGGVGCALTSMATIASFYGMEISPLGVRDIMLSLEAIDSNNNTSVSMFQLTAGNKTLKRTQTGGTFADIVAELRGGNAVLLKVPNKGSSGVAKNEDKEELPPLANGSYRFNGKGHYIVAYGLNPSLQPASAVTAADILVSDPAYSYSQVYGAAYTAGEELVHVTLADYFGRIAADPNYVFDVLEWFDHSRFRRSTGELVNAAEPSHIQRWRVVERPLPPEPSINVNSPVELAITANGKRYVSAPVLASAGDVLLERIAPDNIGAFDEENDTGTGADDPFEEFPPYTLLLPPELAGLSLDFEILGIGAGSYKIVLNPAKPGFESTSFLAGNTTLGQTNLGRIEVVIATNTFAGWAVGFPALGNQNGFSDDPDGDGISNGFERFFGTHPLEASAGLTLTAGSTIAGFQHTRSKSPGTDAVAAYEWSTNLTTWHPSGETVAGISVTLTAVVIATTATTETVAITPISAGAPSVLFYRLRLQLLE